MKFLNVYCERRKAEVFIAIDKIVLIAQAEKEGNCYVKLLDDSVEVAITAEELIRKINGENRAGIGFRTAQ